ncbi:MAG TPA: enoyl-CoA hydratase/isomerase family protein [Pseudomonadales bacterium]|nr:enoyl-CoA hydratase/isomerase family protein [Pseudomonadales bacterium]
MLEITLNRPAARNAFSTAMRDGLVAALHLLASDPTLQRARIRGAGACFCSGGDLEEFGLAGDLPAAHAIRSTRNAGRLIAELAPRVECHVHRACIGSGIELPAFAGCIVATPDTLFQLPEISLGLIPGAGGTVSITRRIGRQRTAWLALSARRIDAPTALEWGLIDAIGEG